MIRYTAILRYHGNDIESLRSAVDRELSRSLFTYRLGAAAERTPGEVLVEVASEIGREQIARMLETSGVKLGFVVERVGWGWLLTRDVRPEPSEVRAHFSDPLVSVDPQQEGAKEYRLRVRPLLLYMLRIFFILATGGVVLLAIRQDKDVWWVLGLTAWAFVSYAPTGSFSRLSSLRIDEEGIEIRRWLPRSSEQVRWGTLDGLDLRFGKRECRLLVGSRWVSVSLSAPPGDTTWLTIAKTIVERANLNFTGGIPFGSANYRRFEAE